MPTYSGLVIVVRVGEAHYDGPLLRAFLQSLTRGERAVAADPARGRGAAGARQPERSSGAFERARAGADAAADGARRARATRSATRTPTPGRRSAPGWRRTACSPTARTPAWRSPTSSCRARASRSSAPAERAAHRVGRGETAPRRVGREELAHLLLLARAPAGHRRCAAARRACAGRGRRPEPGRSGPARAARGTRPSSCRSPASRAAAASRARDRRRAGRCARAATSRAARRSASARPAERSKDSSSAGAVPASVSALGTSRSGVRGSRAPATLAEPADDAPLDRGRTRVLDQLLADRPGERLERLGTPRRAQPGARRTAAPISGSSRKRAWNWREVIVDAEREAHPLERDAADAREGPQAPITTLAALGCAARTSTGCPRRAAGARARRRARASRRRRRRRAGAAASAAAARRAARRLRRSRRAIKRGSRTCRAARAGGTRRAARDGLAAARR